MLVPATPQNSNFQTSILMKMSGEAEKPEFSLTDSKIDTVECDRRCVHQGNRICYNENITKELVRTIPENSIHSSESGSEDSLHSGESLFKTFTFDADEQNPDMEKCMNFWKSILAKNARPLKCSLKTKKETVEKPPKKQEEIKSEWLEVYKDLQRRKLDQIRLVKTKPCDPCPPQFDHEYEKKEQVEEIKKLNQWKSKSSQPKLDVKSQMRRTLEMLQTVRTGEKRASTKDEKKDTKTVEAKEKRLEKKTERKQSEKKPETSPSQTTTEPPEKSEPEKQTKLEPDEGSTVSPPLEPPPPSEQACACGCGVAGCICTSEAAPEEAAPSSDLCICGCKVEDCICEAAVLCPCGCGVSECICGTLDGKVCTCGCGLGECICQQLYSKTCKCGNEDCECGMMEVLNAYLGSLNSPCQGGGDEGVMVTEGNQTEAEEVVVKRKKGCYCVICGHFDCCCMEEEK